MTGNDRSDGTFAGQLAYASAATRPVASLTPRLRLALLWLSAAIAVHYLIACSFWIATAVILVQRHVTTGGTVRWVVLIQSLPAIALLALAVRAWRRARSWRKESLRTLLLTMVLAALLYTVEHALGLYQMHIDGGGAAGTIYFNSWLVPF